MTYLFKNNLIQKINPIQIKKKKKKKKKKKPTQIKINPKFKL